MPVVHVRANEVLKAIGIHRNRFLTADPKPLFVRTLIEGVWYPIVGPRRASCASEQSQQEEQRTCARESRRSMNAKVNPST